MALAIVDERNPTEESIRYEYLLSQYNVRGSSPELHIYLICATIQVTHVDLKFPLGQDHSYKSTFVHVINIALKTLTAYSY